MTPEELTDDAINHIFDQLDHQRLSPWERNFVESISDQWDRNHSLSDRQKEVLGQIWDRQP